MITNLEIKFFKNKTILITGGTGSLGNKLVKYFLVNKIPLKKLIIFSRDEFKQFELKKKFPEEKFKNLRYFLGDIRDRRRIKLALNGVDFVIHAAALKHVPAAEYNPTEFIKTNIGGANNLIEAALETNVKRVIALSTDKASSPVNLYGATKLCSDKLFVSANNLSKQGGCIFSIVRYGNVFASRGSVAPIFVERNNKNLGFNLTHKDMTRFNITLDESIKAVIWSLVNAKGREIFVPKLKSYRLIDLAKSINSKTKLNYIGVRPGEKIHEELISKSESLNTVDLGSYYAIMPDNVSLKKFYKNRKSFNANVSYNSNMPKNFLDINELKRLILEIRKI
jgi:UDP-N-acetylglucosamine 4,6-dehydratase/5-epimerase